MRLLPAAALSPSQKQSLLLLWNAEYPQHLSFAELAGLEAYLESLTAARHFLLLDEADALAGWLAVFERQQAPWFVLIIGSHLHGRGYGRQLLAAAQAQYPELNGWVVDHDEYLRPNGQAYCSPLGFYEKNGFALLRHVHIDTPTLSAVQVRWQR